METRLEVRELYTPWIRIGRATIVIEDGIIKRIVRGWIGGENYREYIAAPGFVDTHIHGVRGIELYSGRISDLERASRELVRYGVTSFVPTAVTLPHDKTIEFLISVHHAAENPPSDGARVMGAYLEGPFINPEARGAQNPEYIREPSIDEMRQFIDVAGDALKLIAVAPEVRGALDLIAYASASGIHVAVGHTRASYEQVVDALLAGADRATHLFNAMTRFHHREPGAAVALLELEEFFVEVIADMIHLHPATVELVYRVAGPRRTVLVTDAISAAGLSDGVYQLGGLKVIVEKGVARLENGALAGSTLTLDRAVRNCVSLGIPLSHALAMASWTPARSIGEQRAGCLRPGCVADLVLLDSELKVAATIVRGEEVFSR
ncbi:MAG: N-acetylglucosamine-6-phosphate deacetylase [Crenarchaeota archaeon]|nr:N-acetylglucosamine-6-phosphate deacetylase [Thermoproteota archaeon]